MQLHAVLHRFLCAVLFVLVAATPAARADVPATTPEQVIQNIADELGRAIEGHQNELRADREKLLKTIDGLLLPNFDIDYASILVLGQHARSASVEQRSRFAQAFYKSIAHKYAEGLLNYTRGKVRVLPRQGELNDKRTIARTTVLLDDGKKLAVDYAFRRTKEGQWKAYDVVIEGISYITNYRNQVDAEVRKEGLDALIVRLETQGGKVLEDMDKAAKGGR